MEKLNEPKSTILTRMSYMCNIMVYYGYIHECAEFFRSLCKASQESWDNNVKAIVNVIMKHEDTRFILEFSKPFSDKIAEYLLRNNNYNYYSIIVTLDQNTSYRAAINFICNLEDYSTKLFNEVRMVIKDRNYELIKKFIGLYIEKGFEIAALTNHIQAFNKLSVEILDQMVMLKHPIPFLKCIEYFRAYHSKVELCYCMNISTTSFRRHPIDITKYYELDLQYRQVIDCLDEHIDKEVLNQTCQTIRVIFSECHRKSDEKDFSLETIAKFIDKYPNCTNLEIKAKHNRYFSKVLDQFCSKSDEEIKECNSINRLHSLGCHQVDDLKSDINIRLTNQIIFYAYQQDIKCLSVENLEIQHCTSETFHTENFLVLNLNFGSTKLSKAKAIEPKTQEMYAIIKEYVMLTDNVKDTNLLILPCKNKLISPILCEHYMSSFVNSNPPFILDVINKLAVGRDSYELVFYDKIELEQLKERLQDVQSNSLFSISVNTYQLNTTFESVMTPEIIDYLFTLNILEFRTDARITCETIIHHLANCLESNTKIRDIELNLSNNDFVFKVFKSLDNNYMIKTVRLLSNKKVTPEILEYTEDFRSKRVGVEIALNSTKKLYKNVKNKSCEMHYPN